tara:strand:- start:3 stop:428 length:426 start_codon:yes stop_codon:yes gene_type:complete
MTDKFEQISNKPGFMKYNGGILFRKISDTEFEFKTTIDENKLNSAGITHGGYICSIIDAGSGTAAHRASNNTPCVTISLDIKFISPTKNGDEIKGFTKIQKITKSMVFLVCYLESNSKLVASASGVWKKLNKNVSDFGPGG